tara:strand:+ start:542 stop:1186 length:645 start_codon:yes stop_codon:yes gene_type:complete
MEQDIEIINANTRNEKIKNFFINNKNKLITFFIAIILCLFSFFYYEDYKTNKKKKISNRYNNAITNYKSGIKTDVESTLKEIIKNKDSTYSPLAFYFLLDNELINSNEEINSYFDLLIKDVELEEEIKNLIIFKKGLYNSDFVNENELLDILNPIIKSENPWKSHALYLMAEYYLAQNQKQKSKEFFNQIVKLENISSTIKVKAQKRLRTDFSE